MVAPDLMEVDLHEKAEHEEAPARKLSKLSPVEEMTGIVFKDEDIIDFVFVPHAARQAEK